MDRQRRRVIVTSTEAITDLATDRADGSLQWVDRGTLHRRVNGHVGSLVGAFPKAAFFPV